MPYAKLKLRVVTDKDLLAVAEEHGPIIWAIWVRMIVSGKESIDANREGWAPFALEELALFSGGDTTAEQVGAALKALQEAQLMDVEVLTKRRWHIRPANVADHQSAAPTSGAERTRRSRAKKKALIAGDVTNVTLPVTPTVTLIECNVMKYNDKPETEAPLFSTPVTPSVPSVTDIAAENLIQKNRDRATHRKQVFQFWLSTTGRSEADGYKMTKERAAKIDSRLSDGFTVEQLQAAISFYWADPYHRGENERKTEYTDLVTMLRNETKVQKALESAADGSRGKTDISAAMREVFDGV